MPTKKFAFDSCVFISLIDGDEDRVPDISAILEEAEGKTLEVVTSTLSCVEVAFSALEKQDGKLDQEVDERINDLWRPGSVIEVVDLHPVVVDEARELVRKAMVEDGPNLKPPDAIHLATAVFMEATEFHTYDEKLFGLSDLVGIPIREPKPHQGRLGFGESVTEPVALETDASRSSGLGEDPSPS